MSRSRTPTSMAFPKFRYHDDRVQVVRNAWNIRTSTFGAHGRYFANALLVRPVGDAVAARDAAGNTVGHTLQRFLQRVARADSVLRRAHAKHTCRNRTGHIREVRTPEVLGRGFTATSRQSPSSTQIGMGRWSKTNRAATSRGRAAAGALSAATTASPLWGHIHPDGGEGASPVSGRCTPHWDGFPAAWTPGLFGAVRPAFAMRRSHGSSLPSRRATTNASPWGSLETLLASRPPLAQAVVARRPGWRRGERARRHGRTAQPHPARQPPRRDRVRSASSGPQ